MQILATLQNRPIIRSDRSRFKGFTLIEIMVVLILLGMLSSIVLPRLTVIYDNFIFRTQRDEILKKLSNQGFEAYNQQQAVTIDTDNAAQWLELPEDWQLIVASPIKYQANGFCLGGIVTLTHAKLQASYQLSPPYCRPQL